MSKIELIAHNRDRDEVQDVVTSSRRNGTLWLSGAWVAIWIIFVGTLVLDRWPGFTSGGSSSVLFLVTLLLGCVVVWRTNIATPPVQRPERSQAGVPVAATVLLGFLTVMAAWQFFGLIVALAAALLLIGLLLTYVLDTPVASSPSERLNLVAALVASAVIVTLFMRLVSPQLGGRAVLVSLFLMYGSGFSWSIALIPGTSLSLWERLFLSPLLSITLLCTTILVGTRLGLAVTPMSIVGLNVLLVLAGILVRWFRSHTRRPIILHFRRDLRAFPGATAANSTSQADAPAPEASRSIAQAFARLWSDLSVPLLLLLVLAAVWYKVDQTPYLYSYDPTTHLFLTAHGEPAMFFSTSVALANGTYSFAYPSFLRSFLYVLSTAGGIELFDLYRAGVIFLRVLYLLALWSLVMRITGSRKAALLVLISATTSWYFAWRSYITYPENLALVLHLAIWWALELVRRSARREYAVILSLLLAGLVYTHPKSLYVTGFILLGYVLFMIVHAEWRKLRLIIIGGLIGAALALPALPATVATVVDTVVRNVGSSSSWGLVVEGTERYIAPTPTTYSHYLGPLLIVSALLGTIVLIRHRIRANIHLLVPALLTFLLSLGTGLQIYVPTDRMQGYLLLPVAVMVGICFNWLLNLLRAPLFMIVIAIGMSLLSLLTIHAAEPWFAYGRGEVPVTDLINNILAREPLTTIRMEDASPGRVLTLLNFPDQVCLPEPAAQDVGGCASSALRLLNTHTSLDGYVLAYSSGNLYLYRQTAVEDPQ